MKKYIFLKIYVWYREDLYKPYSYQRFYLREFAKDVLISKFFYKERNLFGVTVEVENGYTYIKWKI